MNLCNHMSSGRMPASLLARFVGMNPWVLGLGFTSLGYQPMALFERLHARSDVDENGVAAAGGKASRQQSCTGSGGMHEPL
jgi:hypothetical protein